MVLVLLGWFGFRHFYVTINKATVRRGENAQERLRRDY